MKLLSAVVLSLGMSAALASPSYLVTHNNTNEQSNAYIAGTIPSPYPTAPNSTAKVYWNMVKFACYGHSVNNQCSAEVKMATDTANPIVIATVSMDLDSGLITILSKTGAGGYDIIVNGPGETTVVKN